MPRSLAVASIVGMMMVSIPALSHAGGGEHRDHSAPEPLTMLGFVLGAGGVAVARWASQRKSRIR